MTYDITELKCFTVSEQVQQGFKGLVFAGGMICQPGACNISVALCFFPFYTRFNKYAHLLLSFSTAWHIPSITDCEAAENSLR